MGLLLIHVKMINQYQFSLKVRNYKCFGNKPQGFDQIKLLNLILGRNNTGKSTLLDLIEELSKYKSLRKYLEDNLSGLHPTADTQKMREVQHEVQEMIKIEDVFWHNKTSSEILIEVTLTEGALRQQFSDTQHIHQNLIKQQDFFDILFPEHAKIDSSYRAKFQASYWDIGKRYVDSKVTLRYSLRIQNGRAVEYDTQLMNINLAKTLFDPLNKLEIFLQDNSNHRHISLYKHEYEKLKKAFSESCKNQFTKVFTPFINKQFKRIYPDRNIEPEEDNISVLHILGDGRGVTNIIQNFYNQEILDS